MLGRHFARGGVSQETKAHQIARKVFYVRLAVVGGVRASSWCGAVRCDIFCVDPALLQESLTGDLVQCFLEACCARFGW